MQQRASQLRCGDGRGWTEKALAVKNLRAELGSGQGLPDGERQPEAESQALGECFSHFKSFTDGGPRMDVGGKREGKAGVLFGVSPASHPCESCDWELGILGVFVFL